MIELPKGKTHELPAFDMVRAAVNLMVASVLISIATSYEITFIYNLRNFYGGYGYFISR